MGRRAGHKEGAIIALAEVSCVRRSTRLAGKAKRCRVGACAN